MVARYLYGVLCCILGTILSACDTTEEGYIDNPNNSLDFSTKIVSFDTVFSTAGSATSSFNIYNNNDKTIFVNDIILAGGGESGFRVCLDGKKGNRFRSVSIQAGDSLTVTVGVTVNPNDKQAILMQDSLLLSCNGRTESVLLEACGQDVNYIKNGLISEDTYFDAEKPYFVYDSLVIAPKTTLVIQEGTVIYMHDRASIVDYGTLIAKGTLTQPIQFRGDKQGLDLATISPFDHAPSRWGGIFLQNSSFYNEMEHVVVQDCSFGITMEKSSPETSKLFIKDSQVTNSEDNILSCFDCKMEAINTEFSNAGGCVVLLLGGDYSFTHCTIANFLPIQDRAAETLTVSNNANNINYPLFATFDNCVIDGNFPVSEGNYYGELNLSDANGTPFDYRFNHCLIKSEELNGLQFDDVIFTDKSPTYRLNGGSASRNKYDFRPKSSDILVGKADMDISAKYPKDKNGVNRIKNNAPTIGAYEYASL